VSRYKLSRSQEFITVQDFNCVQMRVSGCNNHYKFVLGAEAKAKSVTNNLPILSVLAERYFFVPRLDHILKAFSFIILAVRTISLISDGSCLFCQFLSVANDLSAFLAAFKAYNAAPNEWSAI